MLCTFGEDAVKQCVAKSLSALTYNKRKRVDSCNDPVQIMEVVYVINWIQWLEIAMPEKHYLPD